MDHTRETADTHLQPRVPLTRTHSPVSYIIQSVTLSARQHKRSHGPCVDVRRGGPPHAYPIVARHISPALHMPHQTPRTPPFTNGFEVLPPPHKDETPHSYATPGHSRARARAQRATRNATGRARREPPSQRRDRFCSSAPLLGFSARGAVILGAALRLPPAAGKLLVPFSTAARRPGVRDVEVRLPLARWLLHAPA